MTPEHHEWLIGKLKKIFNTKLLQRTNQTRDLTLHNIWSMKKNVLCFYHHKLIRDDPFFWHSRTIHSPWPNVTNTSHLKEKLIASLIKRTDNRDVFHVLQGLLTPDTRLIFKGLIPFVGYSDIQQMALEVNPKVIKWLKSGKIPMEAVNVVILDYFEHSELVDFVIEINKQRAKELEHSPL